MILVVNAGSSSIKVALFDADLEPRLSGSVSEIGGQGALHLGDLRRDVRAQDHRAALDLLLEQMERAGYPVTDLRAAAHRVVHGGTRLTAPVVLDDAAIGAIRDCIPLAPLHNAHNLAGIEAIAELAPDLPQTATFDTAFHAGNPEVASQYALPPEVTARGFRRYGFHGTSYAALVAALPQLSGQPLPKRLLACHLGNGASLCAIRDGRSVATTMGYSPLAGLTMGTRSGDVDPNAVLALAERDGIEATREMLNHHAGLRGLSGGTSDMRALLEDGGAQARFAVDHFVYWTLRHAGSMIAAMEGIDAIAFTGGIGEHAAPVRERVMQGLHWTGLRAGGAALPRLHAEGSEVSAWVVPAQEERRIAADALELLG